MTLRHLRIFSQVCKNDSNTTRAAEKLYMTQPAVSLAIRELETHYGVQLFDRIGRRLQLTEAGRRLQSYAVQILSLADEMEQEMQNKPFTGLLKVGASITIGSQFLPDYVKRFSRRFPEIRVQVLVGPSDRLEQKIAENELDLALIEGVPRLPNLISEAYMEDELAVIGPADGRFSEGQILSEEEFRRQNFLLRERGSGTRETFERTVETAGFSVEPIWEAMSTTALISAVSNGLGIAVLPRRMVADAVQRGRVVSLQVEGLRFGRKFYRIRRRDKTLGPAAEAFLSLCQSPEA